MAEDRMLNDEIMLGLIKANGGGGGGTSDYSDLSNKPQINNVELSGNKSASDLGIVAAVEGKGLSTNDYNDADKAIVGGVTAALAGKQNALTAGNNIKIDNNTISVNRWAVPAGKVVYTVITSDENYGQNVHVQRHTTGGAFIDDRTFLCEMYKTVNIDSLISIYNPYASFTITLLKNSDEHQSGYSYTVNPLTTPTSNSFTFMMEQEENDNDLIIREELDAVSSAVSAIKDGQSIDSFADVETALAGKADITDLAPAFSTATAYTVGQYVSYDGNIYKCTSAHSAGAWVAGDFTLVAVASELETKQNATDNNLETTSKTVVGAVNELKSGFTTLDNEVNGDSTAYPYADVITIEDAVPSNLADCTVKIEPVQDLHGYDHPWVGGADKNKLPLVLADIKSANTDGTWADNVYTWNDVTFTIQTDTDGNVTGIKVNGTASANANFILVNSITLMNDCILTGCPENGGSSRWYIGIPSYGSDTGAGLNVVAGTYSQVYIRLTASVNLNNAVFYPMLRLSTETDATFAPYTNYCPISGHTEASVVRDGVNLCSRVVDGYIDSLNNALKIDNDSETALFYAKEGVTYTRSFSSETTSARRYTLAKVSDDNLVNNKPVTDIQTSGDTWTATWTGYTLWYLYASGSTEVKESAQIEVGSVATPYVPYAGKTYTIALGDTYYKGLLDVDTGVFTSYNVKRLLNDPDKWISTSGNIVYKYNEEFTDRKQYASDSYAGVFTSFISIDPSSQYTGRWQASDSNYFGIRDDNSLITLEQLKTRASAGDLSICYELATPTTIQLTPTQIQLLKGQNTLTASTGDISVTVNGVAGAIGSLTSDKQDKTDYALNTTAKTVVGGINEVNTLANAINSRTFANNTPVFFVPNWRGGQNYNDIVLNKLEKLRCGFLLTKAGIFPFQTNTNGDGFIVDSGVNLTITNEGNNTYRFACTGEWYTTCLFMFLWDYR